MCKPHEYSTENNTTEPESEEDVKKEVDITEENKTKKKRRRRRKKQKQLEHNDEEKEIPELPQARRIKYVTEYTLSQKDAEMLTSNKYTSDYFETTNQQVAEWYNSRKIAPPNEVK